MESLLTLALAYSVRPYQVYTQRVPRNYFRFLGRKFTILGSPLLMSPANGTLFADPLYHFAQTAPIVMLSQGELEPSLPWMA